MKQSGLRMNEDDGISALLDQCAKPLFALVQLFLHVFACCNITCNSRSPDNLAASILHRGDRDRDIDELAIFSSTNRLKMLNPLFCRQPAPTTCYFSCPFRS